MSLSLDDIIKVVGSDSVFAVLFVFFLFLVVKQVQRALELNREMSTQREQYIMDMHDKQMSELKENMLHERNSSFEMFAEQRKSFDAREAKLLEHLSKNTDQLGNISETLKDIQRNLSKLEDRVEDNFMEVWKELGSKQDKNNKRSDL